MKKFTITKLIALSLLCLVGLLQNCGKVTKVNNDVLPEVSSFSRVIQCELIINGRIVNTKNLAPIEGAIIESESFQAMTDENGEFSVSVILTEDNMISDVKVTKDSFLIKEFKAYLGSIVQLESCPLATNISWAIALSKRQEGVWVGPKDGAWYKVMDTVATQITNTNGELDTVLIARTYTIDVRRGSIDEWTQVFISPNHNRAIGPGIPTELRDFFIDLISIETGTDINSLNNDLSGVTIFDKPLDIRCPLFSEVLDPNTLTPIDLFDLSTPNGTVTIGNNGEIIFLTDKSGLQGIGELAYLEEIIIPVLTAIRDGEALETIEALIQVGLEEIGTRTGSQIGILTDTESLGRIANQATFFNCDCGTPNTQTFTAELEGNEVITITSPLLTPEKTQLIFNLIRTLVGASANNDQSVSVLVSLDKCESKTVTSQEIVRTVTGVVLGIPFTYQATDRLETTEVAADCPITTTCHQGCPE